MKTLTLNAGNFGGMQIEAADEITKIAIVDADSITWCYDLSVHKKSATADFFGCDVDGFEADSKGVLIVAAE